MESRKQNECLAACALEQGWRKERRKDGTNKGTGWSERGMEKETEKVIICFHFAKFMLMSALSLDLIACDNM